MAIYGSYGLSKDNLIITIGASLIFDIKCVNSEGYPIDLSDFDPVMVIKTPLENLTWTEYVTVQTGNVHVHVPHAITAQVQYPGKRNTRFQHGTWDISLVSKTTEDVVRLVYGEVEIADTNSSKVVVNS